MLSSPTSRRQFLRSASVSVALPVLAPLICPSLAAEAPKKCPVGSNIYGWSQYYQRQGKNVNDHLDELFTTLHDLEYEYLEGFLDLNQPDNNARLADRMRAKGLRPVCLYTGARLHEAGNSEAVVVKLLRAAEVCQKAGFSVIDCNPDPIGREKTDQELATQAKALNDFGAGLKRLGIRLGIHNHTPEMANHAREFHQVFRDTDPGLVGLCYDVHWVFRGGIAPKECLKECGNRIVSLHLRQSRNGPWWEDLDTGDIDYSEVARFVQEHHLTVPLTVELAIEEGTKLTRSAVENHRRSREYVRRVFGV